MKLFTPLLILISASCFGQFQFISPLPNSTMNNVEHNIVIREGSILNSSTVESKLFTVNGSISGTHRFKTVLARDGKTIILTPENNFSFNEKVTVTIASGLKSETKKQIGQYQFSFTTHREYTEAEKENFRNAKQILLDNEKARNGISNEDGGDEVEERNFTGGYMILKDSASTPGQLFFDEWGSAGASKYDGYNILEPNGDSVYFSPNTSFCTDFDLNPNGYLSYFSYGFFAVLDSNYNNIDNYYAANGFGMDAHEFTMDVEGNAWFIATDYEVFDMTVYDPSYCSNATIIYTVIQELDKDKNLIFEWNSKDHVDITEAPHENLAYCYIDYMHTNSIDVDADGNIITSNRHLDQIIKIDKNTGGFIWRLGGDSNQFTFINEPEPFTYEHCARELENGNIILWDNGDWHSPAHSMAKEYQLDLENKTATLVWSYQPLTYQYNKAYWWAMGSVQRLSNGNTMIGGGWDGSSSPQSNFYEVTPTGKVVWELELNNTKNLVSYRVHKHSWNPCAPVNPAGIKVKKITSTSAKVVWDSVSNATSYDVQYRKA
ncbi:MAG: aryl-sulfate sulfotransferase, partial [Chitinophagales bacterium]|nr:aryl-sulfate sulfotransferase [Chitinophagales bacterium]